MGNHGQTLQAGLCKSKNIQKLYMNSTAKSVPPPTSLWKLLLLDRYVCVKKKEEGWHLSIAG